MKALLFMPLLAMVSCQPLTAPENPQQIVFAAEAAHNVALTIAVAYAERPSCKLPTHPVVCAEPAIAAAIDKADDAATVALEAAEMTVRTPGFGDDVYMSAALSARAAVSALSAIVVAYK